MSNEIKFIVLGDVKDLETNLAKAKKSFDAIGGASAIAFAGMTASAYGFIEAAREQETAINALNQALQNQGNYTEQASKELVDYASSLQEVSLFGDETIVKAQAMIASFGIEGQTLKDLTKATLDLAQAKGMDLVSAADLVAKAVGSSTNALGRYGIQLDDVTGKSEKADAVIKGINKLYAGQAEAATNGLGATVVLKNAMDDLAESVGMALAPTVLELTNGLKQFIDLMRQNPEVAKFSAETIVLGIAVTGVATAVWAASSAFTALATTTAGLLPLMTSIAPVAAALFAGYKVTELAQATYEWATAQATANKELAAAAEYEQQMLAAYGVTKEQVMSDAAMRIEIVKTVSAAEAEAAQAKIANEQRVTDELDMMKEEMRAISAITTQQEIDEFIYKLDAKRNAEIAYLNMQQQMYAENGALTIAKEAEFNELRAQANADYAAIEYQAKQQQQNKLSALDQKGLDIARKVNADKIGSLTTTLQQAAQLNSKFANAYKAIAIGEAIMSTASGVARALKDYPFPASIAVAALVGAMGAVQIATIAGQSFAVGTPEIPRDMNARVHQGEMIVPATFSEAIRSGELSLSGGGGQAQGSGITNVFDFAGAVFNGITEEFVQDIFTKASEKISNRTLIFGATV